MEKFFVLGTGCAMVTKCYNTCFTVDNGKEHFLVDTGGGNTILTNLEKCGISYDKIHNVFISHSHNDHIMGLIWVIRAVAQKMINYKYEGNLNIYCDSSVIEAVKTISNLILQKKFTKFFDDRILFIPVEDGSEYEILDWKITFFDIKSTKLLQYGFTFKLSNGKILTFLGDEPYRDELSKYAFGVDYLLHEAYCLYSQRDIFKPYEKHHATVKDACENAERLQVKNVLLYHTEDKNINSRKHLYTEEGSRYFLGNILIPEDLEVIELK